MAPVTIGARNPHIALSAVATLMSCATPTVSTHVCQSRSDVQSNVLRTIKFAAPLRNLWRTPATIIVR